MRSTDMPPAAKPHDAQPSATPVARLLQWPEGRRVLWPDDGEQSAELGIAKVPRHPGNAGPGQIESAKSRCGERVELVDVISLKRKLAAQVLDPRLPGRSPARMHNLALVPGREAPVALRETMLDHA